MMTLLFLLCVIPVISFFLDREVYPRFSCMIFSIIFLFSTSFISIFIFVVSFFLLALGLTRSSLPSFLRWKLGWLVWVLSYA